MQKFNLNTKINPQNEFTPGRSDQIRNNAGGVVFQVSDKQLLDRFLLIGTEGGTYYVKESQLSKENATKIIEIIKKNGKYVVERTVEVSQQGLAPKNDQALFVLALASAFGDADTRSAAFAALPQVARIGTHLFHFAAYRDQLAGWGSGMRKAVANWYNSKSADKLAFQVAKYAQRDGWSHRDLLRLSHAVPVDAAHQDIFAYITGKEHGKLPAIIEAAETAKVSNDKSRIISLINEFSLTREMINTQFQNDKDVQLALLNGMGITAVIRNLGNMSKSGLLAPMSEAEAMVLIMLRDGNTLKKGRVHPISILMALKTYAQGFGFRGTGNWEVNQRIVDALNDAFYASFGYLEKDNSRTYIGLDVSGSMSAEVTPGLSCAEAASAMCMAIAETQNQYVIKGFSSTGMQRYTLHREGTIMRDLGISPKQRLDTIVRSVYNNTFGATDCALPMLDAAKNKIPVDVFVIYTDNETWFGNIHPSQALKKYRKEMGIDAKLVVCGMTANNFTIADPTDLGMMDVVGFDPTVPQVIQSFAKNHS